MNIIKSIFIHVLLIGLFISCGDGDYKDDTPLSVKLVGSEKAIPVYN